MKAMILAAGLGTRLQPLSLEIPKAVVPVLGRPLCSYNMEFLHRAGIRSFVLNVHARPALVRQRVTAWADEAMAVEYAEEPLILGTGGGIRNARELLGGGTFVAMNGDTIVSFPFDAALAFHRQRKALATLVLFPDPERRYTQVRVDAEGRITGFGGDADRKARAGFYTGCQIVEPELLLRIPPQETSCIIRDTYAPLVAAKAPVFGFLCEGSFREFGTPADYLTETLALLAETGRAPGGAPPEDVTVVAPVHIAPDATVGRGARIGPLAVLEARASVAAGASVSRAVLWPDAAVGAGEKVAGAVLTPRSRVRVA